MLSTCSTLSGRHPLCCPRRLFRPLPWLLFVFRTRYGWAWPLNRFSERYCGTEVGLPGVWLWFLLGRGLFDWTSWCASPFALLSTVFCSSVLLCSLCFCLAVLSAIFWRIKSRFRSLHDFSTSGRPPAFSWRVEATAVSWTGAGHFCQHRGYLHDHDKTSTIDTHRHFLTSQDTKLDGKVSASFSGATTTAKRRP
jgi:hypothetical protein